MPLYKTVTINENIQLAIWEIAESEDEFLLQLSLSEKDSSLLAEISHAEKRLEFLAGRKLIKEAFESFQLPDSAVFRNKYGKPELADSDYEISLSHTAHYVTLLIGNQINVGIDIEKPQEKMKMIAQRLFNEYELQLCGTDLKKLSKIWSAKEVLFKLYMKGGIDFKANLFIESEDSLQSCVGKIKKNEIEMNYQLRFLNLGEYFICYNIN